MNNRKYTKIFVWAFLFLYLLVAAISFCHAIEFFSIGNVQWMSVTLAFAFELGLAVCLASILLGTNKDNSVAWILLVLLVIVQVCGNTYSVFKYISLSETEYYQYLAKPLLFFIEDISQETVQIIIAWIMGAILPIVALLMTEMVSRQIKDIESENKGKRNAVDGDVSGQADEGDEKIIEESDNEPEEQEEDIKEEPVDDTEEDTVEEVTEKDVEPAESDDASTESSIVQKIKEGLRIAKPEIAKKEDLKIVENTEPRLKFVQTGPMVQKPKPHVLYKNR